MRSRTGATGGPLETHGPGVMAAPDDPFGCWAGARRAVSGEGEVKMLFDGEGRASRLGSVNFGLGGYCSFWPCKSELIH